MSRECSIGSETRSEGLAFAAIPHSSRLFLDFLAGADKVRGFYPQAASVEAVAAYARGLIEGGEAVYPAERRRQVADALERQNRGWGASHETLEAIRKFRAGAVAAISGQQVGVLGGPLYALLKAVSAVEMAEELERQGIPAVAVFWMATEDHDLAEVSSITLVEESELRKYSLERAKTGGEMKGAPVGRIALGGDAVEMVAEAKRLLGPGWVSEAIEESYGEAGRTYGEAFARLMTRLLGGTGIILVDPLDEELHRVAAPLMMKAAERAGELGAALMERGGELQRAGYHEQVRVTADSTLLFSLEGNRRTVVQRAGEDFLIGGRRVKRKELIEGVTAHPMDFSPNVLLRPVMEDYLFPTAAYFGGPAEVAYFAQAEVVYDRLLGRQTPVLPRLSATLVSGEMAQRMERYGLCFKELLGMKEPLGERLAGRVLAKELRQALDGARAAVEEQITGMKRELAKLDATLVEAAERSGRKMLYQVGKLVRKAARAELRRHRQVEEDAKIILAELLPLHGLQERVLPGIYFLAQHGPELIGRLKEAAGKRLAGHQVIWL